MIRIFFLIGVINSTLTGLAQSEQDPSCVQLKKLIRSDTGSWIIFNGYVDNKGHLFKNDLELYIFNTKHFNTPYYLDSLNSAYTFVTPNDTLIYERCSEINFIERNEFHQLSQELIAINSKDSIKLKKRFLINFPRKVKKIYLVFSKFNGTLTYLDYTPDTKKFPLYLYNFHQSKRLLYIVKEIPIKCLISVKIISSAQQ